MIKGAWPIGQVNFRKERAPPCQQDFDTAACTIETLPRRRDLQHHKSPSTRACLQLRSSRTLICSTLWTRWRTSTKQRVTASIKYSTEENRLQRMKQSITWSTPTLCVHPYFPSLCLLLSPSVVGRVSALTKSGNAQAVSNTQATSLCASPKVHLRSTSSRSWAYCFYSVFLANRYLCMT